MEESTFLGFLRGFVRKLEDYLRAPENSLMVQERDGPAARKKTHFWRTVSACGQTYELGVRTVWPEGFEGSRFLMELAVREICQLFDDPNFFRRGGGGHWCFYPYAHDWHTTETLAKAVYELICAITFQWLHDSFGIDPLSVSRVAGMAYESRSAMGEIAFHTGGPLGAGEVVAVHRHESVSFTAENARFIRKQLAGVGQNSLLFTRDGPDQPYIYAGYLKAGIRTFLSVRLKRDGMWVLFSGGRPLLQVKSRDVFLPEDPIGQAKRCLRAEFGARAAGRLTPVLEALCGHKHGTSVIFLDEKDEASHRMLERLEQSGRALRTETVHIIGRGGGKKAQAAFDRLLGDIACIDGAFVFDYLTCQLLCVNAIVDGLALLPGRPECGARHNALESAITTLTALDPSRQVKAAAVIFSEDGGISTVTATDCRKKLDEDGGWRDRLPELGP